MLQDQMRSESHLVPTGHWLELSGTLKCALAFYPTWGSVWYEMPEGIDKPYIADTFFSMPARCWTLIMKKVNNVIEREANGRFTNTPVLAWLERPDINQL